MIKATVRRPIQSADRNRVGASLGLRPRAASDFVEEVEAGFPFETVHRLHESSSLPIETISAVTRITPRALSRRKLGGRLSPEQSDRLLRLAILFEQAVSLFQGDKAA